MWLPLRAFVVLESGKRTAEGAGRLGDTCRHILKNLWCMWLQPFLRRCQGSDGGTLASGCLVLLSSDDFTFWNVFYERMISSFSCF